MRAGQFKSSLIMFSGGSLSRASYLISYLVVTALHRQSSPTPVCNKFHLSSRTRHLLSLASPGCIYQWQGSLLCTIYWGQNRLLCMVFTWILSYLRVGALLFISSYLAQNDLTLQSTGRINDLDHTNTTNAA